MRAIISGGGTGGHIFPALAIAEALVKEDKDIEILFVGAKGKMEMERVPAAGYPIEGLWISGFQRKSSLKNWLFPLKLLVSMGQAVRIILRFRPDVIIGVGGFASGPIMEAGYRMGKPIVIQEQNSWPGVTNRLLAKKAKRICVAFDGMERFFPKERIILTGNPVRASIVNSGITREEALSHFGLSTDKKTIVVIGGSLGARTINRALAAGSALIAEHAREVQILWQTGKLYVDEFHHSETALLDNVRATAFIDRMDMAYKMADLVISRAGALSISEIALTGKPSILVPSPNVAEDHQFKNAMNLVQREAASLVKDSEAVQLLIPKALEAVYDERLLAKWSTNVRQLGKPDAAKRIAQTIKSLVP